MPGMSPMWAKGSATYLACCLPVFMERSHIVEEKHANALLPEPQTGQCRTLYAIVFLPRAMYLHASHCFKDKRHTRRSKQIQ